MKRRPPSTRRAGPKGRAPRLGEAGSAQARRAEHWTVRGNQFRLRSGVLVFFAALEVACAPAPFSASPVRVNSEAPSVSESLAHDLTWNPKARRVTCSKTGTSIQILATDDPPAISRSGDDFVALPKQAELCSFEHAVMGSN